MTAFTLAHTAISLLPVGFGAYALARRGRIDPATRAGKWYVGTMLAGSVSGFGFLLTLGFTPGQVLGLVTIALVAGGTWTARGARRPAGYTQAAALTTSFLLLMVFLTTETLKRFPLGQPFASGPADPALIPLRVGLLVGYLALLGRQFRQVHNERVFETRVERFLSLARAA
jgi:hypothetical protein